MKRDCVSWHVAWWCGKLFFQGIFYEQRDKVAYLKECKCVVCEYTQVQKTKSILYSVNLCLCYLLCMIVSLPDIVSSCGSFQRQSQQRNSRDFSQVRVSYNQRYIVSFLFFCSIGFIVELRTSMCLIFLSVSYLFFATEIFLLDMRSLIMPACWSV